MVTGDYIKAHCVACGILAASDGELSLMPDALSLISYGPDRPVSYVFRCPKCDALVSGELAPPFVDRLRLAGVKTVAMPLTEWTFVDGRMTTDDLIDLNLWMESIA
jgi:hypothetical protein